MTIAIAMSVKYYTVLRKLNGHLKGTQFFTFNSRLSDCSNSTGTKSHIFGSKGDNDSVP